MTISEILDQVSTEAQIPFEDIAVFDLLCKKSSHGYEGFISAAEW